MVTVWLIRVDSSDGLGVCLRSIGASRTNRSRPPDAARGRLRVKVSKTVSGGFPPTRFESLPLRFLAGFDVFAGDCACAGAGSAGAARPLGTARNRLLAKRTGAKLARKSRSRLRFFRKARSRARRAWGRPRALCRLRHPGYEGTRPRREAARLAFASRVGSRSFTSGRLLPGVNRGSRNPSGPTRYGRL
jgi:hypothetical protein